ncbi:MAG TPA: hypothetical protein PLN93_01565 [Vicinamibacterales bacterium]|nr:hypothetical protein [Vicinamibacterales bacterium]HOQ60241.1 hypothetical protein [Vicinamibacterales bacterium]HPK70604.1 hypothetical protein [Vicinamibacterales bacterium]
MRFVAFDMEIARPVPNGRDILAARPGIACAALASEGDARARVLFDPGASPDLFDPASRAMTRAGAQLVLEVLAEAAARGSTIVTWNGAGFDFRLLADETGRRDECARLARASVDMMFQVLCERGHPLALDAALRGAGLPPKLGQVRLRSGEAAPIDGAAAPVFWQAGEYAAVLEYCAADVMGTLALAVACQQSRRLAWLSRSGRPNEIALRRGWLTVEQCLALPLPDTSWMTQPLSRDSVVGWTAPSR